jgi:hypothetical protein
VLFGLPPDDSCPSLRFPDSRAFCLLTDLVKAADTGSRLCFSSCVRFGVAQAFASRRADLVVPARFSLCFGLVFELAGQILRFSAPPLVRPRAQSAVSCFTWFGCKTPVATADLDLAAERILLLLSPGLFPPPPIMLGFHHRLCFLNW